MRTPRMSAWRNSVTGRAYRPDPRGAPCGRPTRSPPTPVLLPAALGAPPRNDLVRGSRLLRQDDLGHATLPLADEELALRPAELIPAQRAEDRVDLVLAEPVGELHLAVAVDRPDRLHGRVEHLRRGVGVRGVLGHLRATEHLLILR